MPARTADIVFFGNSALSIAALEGLAAEGLLPKAVVASPDKPKGRGLELASPETKEWAAARGIPVIQPARLDEAFMESVRAYKAAVFLVASYGKIIPQAVLDLPEFGTLNVHPSLLPKYRGPTPIPSQILADDKETGVTVMRLDAEVDHGPLLAAERVPAAAWPARSSTLKKALGEAGGRLVGKVLPGYLSGSVYVRPQEHELATFTRKFSKADGELDMEGDGYLNYLKFCAFDDSVGTFFFAEKAGRKIRVKILDAQYENGAFAPILVVPEGGKQMPYADFKRGL